MKLSFPLLLLLFILISTSCKKDLDKKPEVKSHSIALLGNGNIEVKAIMVSEGSAALTHSGFCADTIGNPEISEMALTNVQFIGDTIIGRYTDVDPFKTYYLRPYLINNFGTAYGETMKYEYNRPCPDLENELDIGTGAGSLLFTSYTWTATPTGIMLTAAFNATNLKIFFANLPDTGFYPNSTAKMNFNYPTVIHQLEEDGGVYVHRQGQFEWEMIICNAPWKLNDSIYYLSAHFKM